MSGGLGAQRVQVTPRVEQSRQRMWALMVTEVAGRLARIDRGESTPQSEQAVRCWRLLVDQNVRR